MWLLEFFDSSSLLQDTLCFNIVVSNLRLLIKYDYFKSDSFFLGFLRSWAFCVQNLQKRSVNDGLHCSFA